MTSKPAPKLLRPGIFWGLMLYVSFGALWIVASDSALSALGLSAESAARFATGKGLLFVLISALWALLLLRMAESRSAVASSAALQADAAPGLARWMLAVALLVPLIGAGVYSLQLNKLEADTARSLQAIAEIGSEQFSRLLHERHIDAAVFALDETQLSALRADASIDARSKARRQLVLLANGYGYSRIDVLDRDGLSVLAHGALSAVLGAPGEPDRLLMLETLESSGDVSLPVRSYLRPSASGLLLQVVVELVDAGEVLGRAEFWRPMTEVLAEGGSLGSRVFPSEESVLGRQLGDQVAFVALRRHESDGRATVKEYPAGSNLLIARVLSKGGSGRVEGFDYRDREVLAGHAPVAGSDWQLLVKVDRADIGDSLLPMIGWIIAVLALCAGLLAIAAHVIWSRQRQLEALRTQSQAAALDRLMQQFFELPFIGMAFTSPVSKRWLRFNDRLCEILGYPRAELAALSWAEITHPEDLQLDVAEFDRVMQGVSDSYAMEKRFIRKDGGIVHTYIDVRCLRRPDHSIEVFIATIDDISQDYAAREALRRSEARWRRIIEEAPFPMIVHDEAGQVNALSRAWVELSGYSAADLPTVDAWLQHTHPDPQERASIRASIASLFGQVEPVDEGEADILCADGSRRVWMFRSMRIGAGTDDLQVVVSMAADVTEQRRLAADLRTNFELYRHLFDANPICMIVYDSGSGRVLAANEAMVASYGWAHAELLGMSIDTLSPQAEVERFRKAFLGLSRQHVSEPGIFIQQRHDGSTLQAEIGAHRLVFEGRDAWLAMAVDVSEREQLKAEREGYIRQLEAAAARTLEVVATMVELRDPYTAGHERRVGELAAAIAAEMGYDTAFQNGLRMCGAVHDVGKIAVPAEILSKPTRLSKAEYQMVQEHAAQGYEILKAIELPWPLAEVARQHHERMDGSGYPRGLQGADILIEARIIAIADVVESMASHRPYRPAVGLDLALAEIEAGSGRLYDPGAVDACLRLFREGHYVLPQ